LPQLYSPLSQLSQQHRQPLLPQQQVLLQKLKLRRTKRSLQKVSLLRKTQKPLRQRQPLSNRSLDDNDDLIIDDEVTFGRNRKAEDFGKLVHEDIELSDHVKFRLWLARQLAMKKYQEKWA